MAKDSTIMYIEDDIKKIQVKTNLYLKSYGPEGVFHLAKEIVQNSIDEVSDPESNGQHIIISCDKLEDSITVEDDGRGISEKEYPLEICCTKLQSGSKFMRDAGTSSAGEFGVGLTCCNALSDFFSMTCFREAEKTKHTIKFKLGKKTDDIMETIDRKGKRHGTITKMIPSKKYLGPTAKMPVDVIDEWISKISYFINNRITIDFRVFEGMRLIDEKTYEQKDKIGLLEDILSDKVVFKPVHLTKVDEFVENVIDTSSDDIGSKTVDKNRYAEYGIMFAYDDSPDPCYDSFCNFTNTTEGGVHLENVDKALCTYLQKVTKSSLTETEKSKMDILWNDVRTGLKLVVYLNTDSNVQFEGNVKEKIGSKVLAPIIYAGATEIITKYFDENPEKLKSLVKLIKTNAKARIEANKVRVATTKEVMTPIKEMQMESYDRCLNTGKNDYRELFICEGKSAKGCGVKMRDPDFQAFYGVRGMCANPFKSTISEIMDPVHGNKEWREIVNVLQCGIGPSFDINKLYFDKIIILTDADVDGKGIAASICTLFVKYLPGVVEAGKLYKSLPPLYKVGKGKTALFPHDKEEYVELYRGKIIKNYDISIIAHDPKAKSYISKSEFKEFLLDTVNYRSDLGSIAAHYRISKFLLERVTAFLVNYFGTLNESINLEDELKNQKLVTKMMSVIQKKYPEVKFLDESCSLSGIADGHESSIHLDSRFVRKVLPLVPIYQKYGYTLLVQEKEHDVEEMSIGMFCDAFQKYVPKDLARFKGLGEMEPADLYETTLDPNSRVLIRLTLDDLKKELKTFETLLGTKKRDKEGRKKLMDNFTIKPEDLDN